LKLENLILRIMSELDGFAGRRGFSVQVSAETEVSNMSIEASAFLFSSLTPDT
jgi:hypothetical protein